MACGYGLITRTQRRKGRKFIAWDASPRNEIDSVTSPERAAEFKIFMPNKGEQLVRYYRYYSNVSRGKRKKEKPGEEGVGWKPEVIEIAPPPISKELKRCWSYFIRKVYETNPLTCPKCQGEMRIICLCVHADRLPGACLPLHRQGGNV